MRNKLDNAKKLAIITFFSNFYFYNHIGTLYQQTRGLNLLQVSSIWSIIVGTIFLAEVPTGVIADKIGRKWSVVIALFLQALGEYLYFFAKDYVTFVFIAILAGIGYAFLSGANEALVYDSLPEEGRETNMKKSMGLIGSAYQLAFFAAPIFGGLIVSQLVLQKFLTAIFLTAISVTIALLISLTLKEPQDAYQHSGESPFTIFREGLIEIRNSKRLQWLIAIAVLTSTFSNALISLYQPYFADASVPTFWIGASLSLGGLLAFILQRYAYRIEQKLGKLGFLIISVWPGIMYILLAMVSLPALLVPIFILAYASMELRNPLLSSYKNEQVHSKNRATVLSLFNMFAMLYVALMGLVFGKIADTSIPIAFTSIGVLIVLFAMILRTDKVAIQGNQTSTS
jgi:MFS family permease